MKPITNNTLFYGDNLSILREYIPDESIDLVYLDPPFNSKRTYNVLFKHESGKESETQIAAFDDKGLLDLINRAEKPTGNFATDEARFKRQAQ